MTTTASLVDTAELRDWVAEARQRTFELMADIDEDRLVGPQLHIVNPALWELGHVAWFQEKWVLRTALRRPPRRQQVDALYDSAAIPHTARWQLPLLALEQVRTYLRDVRDAVLEALQQPTVEPDLAYAVRLSVHHEDMHAEALTYTRQTHGWPPPRLSGIDPRQPCGEVPGDAATGDAEIPGGTFWIGAERDAPFVFDNEQWAHPVELAPFRIARRTVTQGEFAAFVEDGGYRNQAHWTPAGWTWRSSAAAEHPVYWRRDGGGWLRRHFDRWLPLEADLPVIHVNAHEAEAYCRWAGRRLPTEMEWEAAAAGTLHGWPAAFDRVKRTYPWGDHAPTSQQARLDWAGMGPCPVGALPQGDSFFGCRQMQGNVWEWTASDFLPYPGFAPGPYREYSQPWFGTHRVLRGAGWATRSRLARNVYRNYFRPHRRDVFGGFRTCAL